MKELDDGMGKKFNMWSSIALEYDALDQLILLQDAKVNLNNIYCIVNGARGKTVQT